MKAELGGPPLACRFLFCTQFYKSLFGGKATASIFLAFLILFEIHCGEKEGSNQF